MFRRCICLMLPVLALLTLAACSKPEVAPEPENTADMEFEVVIETPDASQTPDVSPPPASADNSTHESESYLAYVTMDDGYEITARVKGAGAEYEYIIYELENFESTLEFGRKMYWTVLVLKDGIVQSTLRQDAEEYTDLLPTADNLVLETDADFDGKNDILMWLGHFGNQGLVRYACYLSRGSEFVECSSFADIANPAIDAENRVVLSSWRNSAMSHSYAMFYFIDGAFVEMERLTEEAVLRENDEMLWTWTDEVFVDGEWQIREYFTEDDYEHDVLYTEKIYGPGLHWDMEQDRWRALFNSGLMSDFSIYDS